MAHRVRRCASGWNQDTDTGAKPVVSERQWPRFPAVTCALQPSAFSACCPWALHRGTLLVGPVSLRHPWQWRVVMESTMTLTNAYDFPPWEPASRSPAARHSPSQPPSAPGQMDTFTAQVCPQTAPRHSHGVGHARRVLRDAPVRNRRAVAADGQVRFHPVQPFQCLQSLRTLHLMTGGRTPLSGGPFKD